MATAPAPMNWLDVARSQPLPNTPPPVTSGAAAGNQAAQTQSAQVPAPVPQPAQTPLARQASSASPLPFAAASGGNQAAGGLSAPTSPVPQGQSTTQAKAAPAPANSASGSPAANVPAPYQPKAPEQKAPAKAQPAAGAKPAPSALDMQAQALAAVPDNIKKMLEGNDPIAQAEYNNLLNAIGPKNQLAMEGMAMKLRQAGQDGPGAGDALLAMMGRDLQFDTDQLSARIGADSAKRLYDLNKWGFEKAGEIATIQRQQRQEDFNTALKLGQFDQAGALWGEMFPGIPFDARAVQARDPLTQQAFNGGMKLVQQLISQGNAEGAKALMTQLATQYPELFGAKTPEQAAAMLQGIDFTQEAWENRVASNGKVEESIRKAVLSGDTASARSAINQYYANMLPGVAETEGKSLLSSLSLDEINSVLKEAGKAPVTEAQKSSIDPVEFAKDNKLAQTKKAASGNAGIDTLLNQLVEFHPEIGKNPALREAARKWLFDKQLGITSDLPPWDPNSLTSHFFSDWPIATFNTDGSVKSVDRDGFEPYSKDHPRGDLTTPLGQAAAAIDSNWESYLRKTTASPDTRMSRKDWYYATKGGTQVDPTPAPGSTATAEDVQKIVASIRAGTALTADQETALKSSGRLETMTHIPDMAEDLGATINSANGGLAILNNRVVQFKPVQVGTATRTAFVMNGKTYIYAKPNPSAGSKALNTGEEKPRYYVVENGKATETANPFGAA